MTDDMTRVYHSLLELLGDLEIRIPIIQRDYAQGRMETKAITVRKRLINDFIHCLKTPDGQLDFNFIYGNVDGTIFYPVDGQQRLTSLYLLHWVLACRSGRLDELRSLMSFTYATRNSANEFFLLLAGKQSDTSSGSLDYQILTGLVHDAGKDMTLRKDICNQPWFSAQWSHDPTVLAALVFMEELCAALPPATQCTPLYDRLASVPSAVTFIMIREDSGNSGNAESAAAVKYLRMNARGKELTTFENVKAMLDAIAKQYKLELNVAQKYDISYIDLFYDMAKKLPGQDLTSLTTNLDGISLAYFRNLFDVARSVFAKEDPCKSAEDYMEQMYTASQRSMDKQADSELLCRYFRLVDRVLGACKRNGNILPLLQEVFQEGFSPVQNRREVALLLYLYHSPSVDASMEQLSHLDYVLKNLRFPIWTEMHYAVSSRLIKEIANHTDSDALSYFAECKFTPTPAECGILSTNDLRVRLKEQYIKAGILRTLDKDAEYFNELESRSVHRKLQYLLWISGLWSDSNEPLTVDLLQPLLTYIENAKIYFKPEQTETEWLKRYAVAGCTGPDGLLSSSEINHIHWESRCHWQDSYYFWRDDEQPREEQLSILKRAYDDAERYSGYVETLREGYRDCWLRYAVLRDYQMLLTNAIHFNLTSSRVEILRPSVWQDFMAQVLLLDNYNIYTWQRSLDVLSVPPQSQSCFGIFDMETKVSRSWLLQAGKTYKHSGDQSLDYYNIYGINYTLWLNGLTVLKPEALPQKILASFYHAKNCELLLYCVSPDKPANVFRLYRCNLSEVQEQAAAHWQVFSIEFDEITDASQHGIYDALLYIYHNKSIWQKSGSGNSHTWHKTARVPFCLPADYTEFRLT